MKTFLEEADYSLAIVLIEGHYFMGVINHDLNMIEHALLFNFNVSKENSLIISFKNSFPFQFLDANNIPIRLTFKIEKCTYVLPIIDGITIRGNSAYELGKMYFEYINEEDDYYSKQLEGEKNGE